MFEPLVQSPVADSDAVTGPQPCKVAVPSPLMVEQEASKRAVLACGAPQIGAGSSLGIYFILFALLLRALR